MARYAEATIQAVNMATAIPTLGKLALIMTVLGIGALSAIVGAVDRDAPADHPQHVRRHPRGAGAARSTPRTAWA